MGEKRGSSGIFTASHRPDTYGCVPTLVKQTKAWEGLPRVILERMREFENMMGSYLTAKYHSERDCR